MHHGSASLTFLSCGAWCRSFGELPAFSGLDPALWLRHIRADTTTPFLNVLMTQEPEAQFNLRMHGKGAEPLFRYLFLNDHFPWVLACASANPGTVATACSRSVRSLLAALQPGHFINGPLREEQMAGHLTKQAHSCLPSTTRTDAADCNVFKEYTTRVTPPVSGMSLADVAYDKPARQESSAGSSTSVAPAADKPAGMLFLQTNENMLTALLEHPFDKVHECKTFVLTCY